MSQQKTLDLQARIDELERRTAEAEKRAAEAEARAAAAEAGKKPARVGWAVVPHKSEYERGKGIQFLPSGKTIEVCVNREGYLDITYDKKFIGPEGKKRPTRGINGRPREVASVLAWMVENPEALAVWAEFAAALVPEDAPAAQ
jgi:hypothetical protein